MKCCLLLFLLIAPASGWGYSVLTHEAVIDASWDSLMVPLIRQKFPSIDQTEIKRARKYAYGGCVIQDLGYYPHGNKFFSDLLHYVRSGDFVMALIQNSQTPEEYAFSLAALSHYASDHRGHAVATNRAVPILYPELRRKYGDVVTYEQKPSAHLKVEFGYDVVQISRGNYVSDDYHDFVGFDVSKRVLVQAFHQTYGIPLAEIIEDLDVAVRSYRSVITGLIPDATKIAWEMNKDEIRKTGTTREKYVYRMTRAEFEKEFGRNYKKPSFFSKLAAFFIRILPKIGPLKILAFRSPTPEVEAMFLRSFEQTLQNYKTLANAPNGQLLNINLDTGHASNAGISTKADQAYEKLLRLLAKQQFHGIDKPLKENILRYYANLSMLREPKKDSDDYRQLLRQLQHLQSVQVAPASNAAASSLHPVPQSSRLQN